MSKDRFDCEIRYTEYAGHASVITCECVEEKVDVVVAVGGDGTINEVARSLTHTDTALGIIPCGSGNGLARHIGIPLDMRKALSVVNNCQIANLDYGIINGHSFFCTCGMGFDAFISQKFAEARKRGLKTYLEKILREGLKYHPETYEISDETGTKKYDAFLIACANASQYGNNAYIAPYATMTDGLLDITIMEPFTVFDIPQICIDLMNHTLDKNPKIKTFRAKAIHISRKRPGVIHFDGDPIESNTDIDVHVEEQGIRIIINPETSDYTAEPNAILSVFSDILNRINNMREDVEHQGRRLRILQRFWFRKLIR